MIHNPEVGSSSLPRATEAIGNDGLFRSLAGMKSLLPALSVLLVACTGPTRPDEEAIRAVMADQEAAWDSGDIPGFMEGYSQDICFVGERGRTCGKAEVTANYLKSYPDKSAMGDLTFSIHEVVPAGASNAWVSGTWLLYRTADTLGGSFSLLWQKEEQGWRILRDHTN